MEYRYLVPDFYYPRERIIEDTSDIILEELGLEMPNKIYDDLEKRLNEAYEKEKEEEGYMKFCMTCWGGDVWDSLHMNGYTHLLCENYYEVLKSSRPISPVFMDFPYKDLNNVCKKHFESYWKKEAEYHQYNDSASIIQRAWRKFKGV